MFLLTRALEDRISDLKEKSGAHMDIKTGLLAVIIPLVNDGYI